jgi:hypothetical protein
MSSPWANVRKRSAPSEPFFGPDVHPPLDKVRLLGETLFPLDRD